MTDGNHSSVDVKGEKIDVGNDVVGRDKTTSNTTNYYGTGPNGEAIHNSLPNQPYFFGRAAELERIKEALDPEAQGWGVLISGPGGIGKTALSIRAAILAPEKTFPTKIFLSAKMTQLTPQGVEKLEDFQLPNYIALLAELGRELGDDAIAKIDPNLRANEVRRLLAERHALIILDSLESFDEKTERPRVFQFLSRLPRSCKAIVTSRRRIDTPAEIIRLDKLERDDALQLIASIAKRNRHLAKTTEAERIELYEITRGNPLLIEWLAGQLGNPKSKCRTVSDACNFMENAPKDNDPLEFVFRDLLDTFTRHETAVLAALTYFTEPAQLKWIAKIAKITKNQADTALADLADRSVMVVENGLYLLPPLTAVFLRHTRPEAVIQTGDRLTNYVYALVHEKEAREDYARFPKLEAEWPNILAALPQFLQGDLGRLKDICYSLGTFLGANGHWDERLGLSLEAEKLAIVANDFVGAGWQAYSAGVVYFRRGQAAELKDCAKRVDKYWATADAREKAYGMRLHGWLHRLERKYPEAIVAYEKALALVRVGSKERLDVVFMLNSLGHARRDNSDYAGAERDYKEALEIASQNGYRLQIAESTGNLAEIALHQHVWSQAENLAREALTGMDAVGHQDFTARNCLCLAQALAGQGRKVEGRPYAQRAVAIYTKLRSPDLAKAQATLKECEDA
jgi:tetratricopeptide (TPR) repeat protein